MIQLSPLTKIFIVVGHIDFRNGIDGLVGICRTQIKLDPFSGIVILFRNRNRNSIKVLTYDGQGFWLHQKRLSSGRFKWWPKTKEDVHKLTMHELNIFLANGNPEAALISPDWKKIA